MKTLLVVLQNAYIADREVEEGYVPDFSLRSFRESLTGKRLKHAIPEGVEVQIRNASPLIGRTADSNFPPSVSYVEAQIKRIRPHVILACGKNANEAIDQLEVDCHVVRMPHPAFRQLSNKTLEQVRRKIERLL